MQALKQAKSSGTTDAVRFVHESKRTEGRIGLFRNICLKFSNLILQFPIMFELQQRFFRQPELLRGEIEEELHVLTKEGSDVVVLDYGCGSGKYSGMFGPESYIGIDINEGMIERARNVHPDHTFLQAGDLSGISDGLANVSEILMVGVIHHLSEEDLVSILSSLPKNREVRLLAIDTLLCTAGFGRFVQLFERGEFLRTEIDHLSLLHRVATEISYKKVAYGKWFELAVFRGTIKI